MKNWPQSLTDARREGAGDWGRNDKKQKESMWLRWGGRGKLKIKTEKINFLLHFCGKFA